MGSLFSSPSPPPPPPLPPIPVPVDTAGEEERKLRQETIARNRRGLLGTIATSERGVLASASGLGQRKRLLGE